MWALVLVAIVVGIIAIQIFIALVALAVSLLGLLVFGIGYGIYYVVFKPEQVPEFLEKHARTGLRYLTHIYLHAPLALAGILVGIVILLTSSSPPSDGWMVFGVVLAAGMCGGWVDLMVRNLGLGEWAEEHTDQIPPIIYSYRGIKMLREIEAAIVVCQARLHVIKNEHPEWFAAIDKIRFEVRNYRGWPSATMHLEWGTLHENTPREEYLLGELYASVENTSESRGLYPKLIGIEVSEVPKRYWYQPPCSCSSDEGCYGHNLRPKVIMAWPNHN